MTSTRDAPAALPVPEPQEQSQPEPQERPKVCCYAGLQHGGPSCN
ncbi:hypothetical protein IWX75_001223 [Arthrobacter sp. CAN_A6]